MADVVKFPGSSAPARDLPVAEIIDRVVDQHGKLTDIVVVGVTADAEIKTWFASGDIAHVIGLLTMAAARLSRFSAVSDDG